MGVFGDFFIDLIKPRGLTESLRRDSCHVKNRNERVVAGPHGASRSSERSKNKLRYYVAYNTASAIRQVIYSFEKKRRERERDKKATIKRSKQKRAEENTEKGVRTVCIFV